MNRPPNAVQHVREVAIAAFIDVDAEWHSACNAGGPYANRKRPL